MIGEDIWVGDFCPAGFYFHDKYPLPVLSYIFPFDSIEDIESLESLLRQCSGEVVFRVDGYDNLGNSWTAQSEPLGARFRQLFGEGRTQIVKRIREAREAQIARQQERQRKSEPPKKTHNENVEIALRERAKLQEDHGIYYNSDVQPVNTKYYRSIHNNDLKYGAKYGIDIGGWVNKEQPVEICVPGERLLVIIDKNSPEMLHPLDTCQTRHEPHESCAKVEFPGMVAVVPHTPKTLEWHRDELGGTSYKDSGRCNVKKDDVRALLEAQEAKRRAASEKVTPVTVSAPAADGSITHVVQPGQHCSLIAMKYGLALHELQILNPEFGDCGLIRPGDRLVIRRATVPESISLPQSEVDQPSATAELPPQTLWVHSSGDYDLLYDHFSDVSKIDNQEIINTNAFLEAVQVISVDREKGAKICFDGSPGDLEGESSVDFLNSGFMFLDERFSPPRLDYLHAWPEYDDQRYIRYCVGVDKPGTVVRLKKNKQTQDLWMSKFDRAFEERVSREIRRRTGLLGIRAALSVLSKSEKFHAAWKKAAAPISKKIGKPLFNKLGKHASSPSALKKILRPLQKALAKVSYAKLKLTHYKPLFNQYYNQSIGLFQAKFGDVKGAKMAAEAAARHADDMIYTLSGITAGGIMNQVTIETMQEGSKELAEHTAEENIPLSEELLGPAISDFFFEEGLDSGSLGDHVSETLDDYVGETAAFVLGFGIDVLTAFDPTHISFVLNEVIALSVNVPRNLLAYIVHERVSPLECDVTVKEATFLRGGPKGFSFGTVPESAKFESPIVRSGNWMMVDLGELGHLGEKRVSGAWINIDHLELNGECGTGNILPVIWGTSSAAN